MPRKLAIAIVGLSLGLLSSTAGAVSEYYGLSRSIRSLGMGGAFYALSDDEYALFYNPAGLSLYPGRAQFMVNINAQASQDALGSISTLSSAASGGTIESIVSNIEALQGKPLYVSGGVMPYFIARGFAVGLLVAEPKIDVSLLGTGIDSNLDVTGISDHGLFLGFAGSMFHPNLHFGLTMKALYRAGGHSEFTPLEMLSASGLQLEDLGGAGGGVDADLGMTYEFKGSNTRSGGLSLSLNNVLATTFPIARLQGVPPPLVRTASLGAYYQWRPGKSTVDYLRFLVDFAEVGLGGNSDPDTGARTGSVWKHVNLGMEMPVWGKIFLRTGLHQGNLTGGLGFSLYAVKLDFATYAEELANNPGRLTNRRWAMRLAFGFGAPDAKATRKGGRK